MARPSRAYPALVAAVALAVFAPRAVPAQNITVDGRISPARTLVGPNYAIGANLGKLVGSNLFHSFGQFGLSTGEAATFSGPAAISNVIGRVTGGSQSNINGKIASTITGASLYLINPSGIVFGPNATVNVSGGFHASTADYLKMSDGAKFRATNPSTLSAAPPAAFGFLTARPAAITVSGSTLGPVPGTLGLVAGPVSISGGTLRAPAGTIHVAGVAGTGEVPVDPRNTPALTVTSFAPVAVNGSSKLDVSNGALGAGGSVFIRSGGLTIDASEIAADNFAGPGGQLVLRGDNQITLRNGASVQASALGSGSGAGMTISTATVGSISVDASTVLTRSFGPGRAGPLSVVTGQLAVGKGAQLGSVIFGQGDGGSVTVTAQGPLSVADPRSAIIAAATSTASGKAGSVMVTAPQITITRGAEIASTTAGTGAGGSIMVTTPGMLVLDGAGVADTQIVASASGRFSGPGGSVMVQAGTLTIQGGARIASSAGGFGRGGDVNIAVTSDILLTDLGPQITGRSTGFGDAGSIIISAQRLLMNNGAAISTEAQTSTATGGNIILKARDLLYLINGEILTSVTGVFGNGGNIAIDSQLVILNHSSIIAETIEGHGGNGVINSSKFIPSTDSIVSVTSELGINGSIVIFVPGALVMLANQLQGRAEVLREACAARADSPLSSLVEAGRGGLPQDPEATLPALYIAGRDLNPGPQNLAGATEAGSGPLHTTARLTMRCG